MYRTIGKISDPQRHVRETPLVLACAVAATVCVIASSGTSWLLSLPLIAACLYGFAVVVGRRAAREPVTCADTAPAGLIEKLKADNTELLREVELRREAEMNHRRVEKDLSTAQRIAQVGNWRWSYVTDELIEGSDEYCRIHGVGPNEIHELLAHQMERSVHPDDVENVEQIFLSHEADEKSYELEYRIVRPSGEVRYVREIGEVAEFDSTGNEWIGTVQDITETKRVEDRLRSQGESLHLISRVSLAANEARSLEEAFQIGLDEVCRYTGWSVGHVYTLREDSSSELVSTRLWFVDDAYEYSSFCSATEQARFERGTELPGRAMDVNQPVASADIASELSAERASLASEAGLQSCFAFPVMVGPNVMAVMEFFSQKSVLLDRQTEEVISQIGAHFGRVVERAQSLEALTRAKGELETRVGQRTAELIDANQALTDEITERKRAEDAARAHETQLMIACNMAGIGAAYWNELEDRYDEVSELYATNYGYGRDEFLAEFRYGDDYCLIHPDDVERYKGWEESISATWCMAS